MYQAGTLSGNPVAMNAGITALEILKEPGTYETLEERSGRLEKGLLEAADASGVPIAINRVGSMITPFFVHPADRRSPTSTRRPHPTRKPSRRSSTRCSRTAYIFRRANTRRGLSAWRTATKRSTKPSPRQRWRLPQSHALTTTPRSSRACSRLVFMRSERQGAETPRRKRQEIPPEKMISFSSVNLGALATWRSSMISSHAF